MMTFQAKAPNDLALLLQVLARIAHVASYSMALYFVVVAVAAAVEVVVDIVSAGLRLVDEKFVVLEHFLRLLPLRCNIQKTIVVVVAVVRFVSDEFVAMLPVTIPDPYPIYEIRHECGICFVIVQKQLQPTQTLQRVKFEIDSWKN